MLVEDLKIADEVHVGNYSGLVEAAAAIGMCSGVFIFATLSDKYGRKWVTLVGVGMASILCSLFGFARTFSQLLFLRFAMGVVNSAQAAWVLHSFLYFQVADDPHLCPQCSELQK